METIKEYVSKIPKYRNTVEFMVQGNYALFTDPVYKLGGEKCSFQIPTYEAIKGILMSVFWKPTIIWIVDAVRIMNPIQMEVKGTRTLKMNGGNDLSYYTYLKNCCYQVRAHFIFNENRPELEDDRNENKYHNIAKRMIDRGGRRDIFLGARECQGYVEPCVFGEGKGFYDDTPKMDFGKMYHGITYADEAYSEETKGKMTVRYSPVNMNRGVIIFQSPWECNLTRTVRKMEVKKFGLSETLQSADDFYKEVIENEPT